MSENASPNLPPGVCVPWERKREELQPIQGDEQVLRKAWEDVDALGYTYAWFCLLAF